MGSTHEDFKDFEKRKYEAWGRKETAQRVGDQQAFDSYVKTLIPDDKVITLARTDQHFTYAEWVGKSKSVSIWNKANFTSHTEEFAPTETIIITGTVGDRQNMEVALYGDIGKVTSDTIEVHGLGITTSHDSYTRQEADDKFAPRGGSGGGGGGSSQPVTVTNKQIGSIVNGAYGLNVFNYREMSRDPYFGVNGKTFTTKGERKILVPEGSPEAQRQINGWIKSRPSYNRLRDNQNFKIHATDIESDHPAVGNDDLRIHISYYGKDDTYRNHEVLFNYDQEQTEQTKTHTNTYSYLYFQIGGRSKPQKGKIELEAWYGDIRPPKNVLDQRFVFKKYNNVTLRASYNDVKDEYKHMRWYDMTDIKLNVLNLKDAELLHIRDNEQANNSLVMIKCPKDCWLPANDTSDEHDHPHEDPEFNNRMNRFKDVIMSNNLCDIAPVDEDGSPQTKPFFMKDLFYERSMDKEGNPVDVPCFCILLGKENRSKWREHLSQTQILYPIKDTATAKWTQLPQGGMIYALQSGQVIETNKYKTIESVKGRGLRFKESPFGYPDIVVNADSIVSVYPASADTLS